MGSQEANFFAGSLSDRQFSLLRDIAQSEAGIMVSDSKRQMIESRLSRHMRGLKRTDIDIYLKEVVADTDGVVKNDLISVLTTNVSSFFRENHHFEIFENDLFPKLLNKARSNGKIRIWSAGCSSGQEPYSIAMMLLEKVSDIHAMDVKILATDIDHRILARARAGKYSSSEADTLAKDHRQKFLRRSEEDCNSFEITDAVKSLVSIRPLNLLRPWPMSRKFDAIFCRNVLIYFDLQTQVSLWPRFYDTLEDDGYLFLGHSERIQESETYGFKPVGVTTYQKSNHQPGGSRSF
ncbi:MAG: protein-glutamate O-methyltransferase [Boseongicola sp.]|nr:protein-glutamate O-methyltransferase [Boseongicola sp.]